MYLTPVLASEMLKMLFRTWRSLGVPLWYNPYTADIPVALALSKFTVLWKIRAESMVNR